MRQVSFDGKKVDVELVKRGHVTMKVVNIDRVNAIEPTTSLIKAIEEVEFQLVKVLFMAVENGVACLVEDLLSRYIINVNARTSNGSTALHSACFNGHLEIVDSLHEHNANIEIEDKDGNLPIHLAVLG